MVTVSEFGKLSDGTSVSKYTIKNAAGMELQVLDLGAILQSAIVPDKDGKMSHSATIRWSPMRRA